MNDSCATGVAGDAPVNQTGEGGSTPTVALFRKADWEVREVSVELARKLVRREHYSRGGSNTAIETHGLFPRDALWESQCVGVCWWLPPTKSAALSIYPQNWKGVASLSRLVIVPGVPKNACSFLICHSMRMIDRAVWPCFVTYADEWQRHTGAIYKAAGCQEFGFSKPERRYVKNGRMVSRKAGPKTRTHSEMLALGCEYVGTFRAKRFVHVVEHGKRVFL